MKNKYALLTTFIILIAYFSYVCQDFLFENIKEILVHFTKKPTISVLMSSYNMERTLPDAIDSIINQTYQDWEIIVINDGSIDKTTEALRKYRTNLKIRTITNHKNLGLIPSLNKGMKRIRGKYIARLDADDISAPNRLERTINLIEEKNLDLVGSWCQELNYYYNRKAKDYFNTLGIGLYVMTDNVYCQSTVLMRKSFLDEHNIKYNPECLNAEDLDFWMQIFLNGGKLAFMGGEPLAKYHRSSHPNEWINIQLDSATAIRAKTLSKIIPNFDTKLANEPITKLMPYIIEGNKTTKIFNQQELINCQKNKCYIWEQTLKQKL